MAEVRPQFRPRPFGLKNSHAMTYGWNDLAFLARLRRVLDDSRPAERNSIACAARFHALCIAA